jgi:hypothetical protein
MSTHVGGPAAAAPAVTAEDARNVAEAARETSWERPSFAKGLYLGDFDLGLIHPHPESTAEETEQGDAFLIAVEDYARTLDASIIERDAKIPDEYIAGLAKLGVFGMKIPQEYGGLGLNLTYYGRALAILGSVHPAFGA